jgi:hypothetical protein
MQFGVNTKKYKVAHRILHIIEIKRVTVTSCTITSMLSSDANIRPGPTFVKNSLFQGTF